MTLQDIFDQLTYGELSQMHIGGGDEGEGIREEDKLRMMAHIQLALTTLHRRFRLKEGRFTLELQPEKSTYVLKSQFAQSNSKSKEPIKYINDLDRQFQDDLLRVDRVLDDEGNELILNQKGNPDSVNTPSYNMLVVPDNLESETLTVVYRADHPKINATKGQYVSFQEEIDLPVTHLEALLYFIASRFMNPVGISGEFHEGNNYAAKFEKACQALEMGGYQVDGDGDSDRFINNGWA